MWDGVKSLSEVQVNHIPPVTTQRAEHMIVARTAGAAAMQNDLVGNQTEHWSAERGQNQISCHTLAVLAL